MAQNVQVLTIRDVMQAAYMQAHEQAVQHCEAEAQRVVRHITSAPTSQEVHIAEQAPLVLAILIAKEVAEWGRAVTAVASSMIVKHWSLPTLAGASHVTQPVSMCNQSLTSHLHYVCAVSINTLAFSVCCQYATLWTGKPYSCVAWQH